MNTKSYLFAACLLSTLRVHGAEVFSPHPANREDIGGSPFLITSPETPSIRIQYVHSASDFVSVAPVFLINEISYSTPSWSGRVPIDVTLPNIEIRMSTTQKNPDRLSSTFADNIGSDQRVVYSGSLHFYETQAELYDIHIPITPFSYDPTKGNLLIDVFNYSPILSRRDPDWTLDVTRRIGDSVSLLSSGSSGASVSSGFLSSSALMTRFTYTPVPEPSTWALMIIGFVGVGLTAMKRRGHAKK